MADDDPLFVPGPHKMSAEYKALLTRDCIDVTEGFLTQIEAGVAGGLSREEAFAFTWLEAFTARMAVIAGKVSEGNKALLTAMGMIPPSEDGE